MSSRKSIKKLKSENISLEVTKSNIDTIIHLLQTFIFKDLGLLFDEPFKIVNHQNHSLGIGYYVFIESLMHLKSEYTQRCRDIEQNIEFKWIWNKSQMKNENNDNNQKINIENRNDEINYIDKNESISDLSIHEGKMHAVYLEGQEFWASRLWLLLYGDDSFQWNFRKRIFSRCFFSESVFSNPNSRSILQEVANNELWFVELVLSKHVKSEESWQYRRWFLSNMRNYGLKINYENELKISERGYVTYSRNYYAWNFRYYIFETWMNESLDSLFVQVNHHTNNNSEINSNANINDSLSNNRFDNPICGVILNETQYIQQYLKRNVSDYSAVNYGLRILNYTFSFIEMKLKDQSYIQILNEMIMDYSLNNINNLNNVSIQEYNEIPNSEKNFKKIYQVFILLIENFFHFYYHNLYMIVFYPAHEALWLQRRSLLHFYVFKILTLNIPFQFIQKIEQETIEIVNSKSKLDIHYNYFPISLKDELEFLKKTSLDHSLDNYTIQMTFATKCCLWICNILKKSKLSRIQIVHFAMRFMLPQNVDSIQDSLLQKNTQRYLEIMIENFKEVCPNITF